MTYLHEVGTYRVLLINNYGDQIALIYLYEPSNKYIGYLAIVKEGTPLPQSVRHSNGVLNIYFHEAELGICLDVLRNEKPVFVSFNDRFNRGTLGTGAEPVGENEEPASL